MGPLGLPRRYGVWSSPSTVTVLWPAVPLNQRRHGSVGVGVATGVHGQDVTPGDQLDVELVVVAVTAVAQRTAVEQGESLVGVGPSRTPPAALHHVAAHRERDRPMLWEALPTRPAVATQRKSSRSNRSAARCSTAPEVAVVAVGERRDGAVGPLHVHGPVGGPLDPLERTRRARPCRIGGRWRWCPGTSATRCGDSRWSIRGGCRRARCRARAFASSSVKREPCQLAVGIDEVGQGQGGEEQRVQLEGPVVSLGGQVGSQMSDVCAQPLRQAVGEGAGQLGDRVADRSVARA